MPQPGRKAMACVIALRAKFGGGSQGIGDALGGALIVGCESDAHVTVIENRVIGPVGLSIWFRDCAIKKARRP